MIFACCHPSIPVESQLPLALKTLCGLSVAEIARAFLKDPETIAKRIYRAREKIRTERIELELPAASGITARLDAVLHCLYLLFNEGYHSSHSDHTIREDLCEEAMRLTYMLTQYKPTDLSRTNALMALFCFQSSRLQSRIDDKGTIILLQHQDRSKWFTPLIQKGNYFLERAAVEETSVYHIEAAIAYLHARAPSFAETNWKAISSLYQVLYRYDPTPFVAMNRAIAMAYAGDTERALLELYAIKGLKNYNLYYSTLAEVYALGRQQDKASEYYEKALALTVSKAERDLLKSKWEGLSGNG
jgi:RNA polymerase sigma-70 factor (ECF subfamily)